MALTTLSLMQRLTGRAKMRHMLALVALDDFRSMGKAARSMGMTQPAMSQLVAELEGLIETSLFLRHSRGVDPTPAGQDLIPVARRILAATEEAAERLSQRQRRGGGLVRVAATEGTLGALLCPILPGFAARHPGVQVQVTTVVGQSLDAALVGEEFDIVACRDRDSRTEAWNFVPYMPDAFVVIAGSRHPLAAKGEATKGALRKAVWLQNHASTGARHEFDLLKQRLGWTDLREVQVVGRVTTLIWAMLQAGTMLSFVPRSVVGPWLESGQMREIRSDLEVPLGDIGFLWKPAQAGSATRMLVETMIAARDALGGSCQRNFA